VREPFDKLRTAPSKVYPERSRRAQDRPFDVAVGCMRKAPGEFSRGFVNSVSSVGLVGISPDSRPGAGDEEHQPRRVRSSTFRLIVAPRSGRQDQVERPTQAKGQDSARRP
jgi:hypothetical protein